MGRLLPARRHRRAGAARSSTALPASSAASCGSRPRCGGSSAERPGHRVTTDAGTDAAFDLVVSNADLTTPTRALRDDPRGAEHRPAPRADGLVDVALRRLLRHRPQYPDLAHHTVLFGPRYRELLHEIFHGPSAARGLQPLPARADGHRSHAGAAGLRGASTCWRRCRTSATRRSTGRRSAPRTPTASWRSSGAPRCPACAHVDRTRRIFTPADFRDELDAFQGSAFSVAPTLTQSA